MINVEKLEEDVFNKCGVCRRTKPEHEAAQAAHGWTHDFRPETDLEYFLRRRSELMPR